MLADRVIHQRLGEARLVALIVAETAVAPHVDHNVALEGLAIFGRELAGESHRLRIIAVHMQDRRLRSEEQTSELQSLMRISYAVFCLTKKKNGINYHT